MKQYNVNNEAGCVQRRVARQTGLIVAVYNNEQAGMDPSLPWSTVCESHGWCVCHPTLTLALQHATVPAEWCEKCMGSDK